MRSGIDGTGPAFETSVRELLSAAYLRPLRDAEREMSPGRGSRLSQILSNVPAINEGENFGAKNIPSDVSAVRKLSLVGLADYMRHSVSMHPGLPARRRRSMNNILARCRCMETSCRAGSTCPRVARQMLG